MEACPLQCLTVVHVPFSPELFFPLCNLEARTPALSVGVDERGLGVRREVGPHKV